MTTLLWFLLTLLAPQMPTSSTIQGTVVRGETNQPLLGLVVGLWPTSRTIKTDQFGRFEFRNVVAGEYTLVVVKDRMKSSLPVSITAIPHTERVTVLLKSPPAISGTVFDPFGERQAAARVQAYRTVYRPNGAGLRQMMSVMTDNLGEFRLFFLQPGEYYVSASVSERDQRLGSVGLRLTPNLSKADEGFPTLFLGDSYTASRAQKVNLGETDQVSMNFYLKAGPRFSVSGRLAGDSATGDACGQVAILPEGGILEPDKDFSANVCGPFRVTGLSPGNYVAYAQGVGLSSDARPFSISNQSVDRFVIPMSRTTTVSGRVTWDDAPAAGARVILARSSGEITQRLEGKAQGNGTFTIQNVGPGFFDVYVDPLPEKAFVRSIQYAGSDGLRGPIPFQFGFRTMLDIRLSSQGGSAEGVAVDAVGRPVPAAEVVLVPETYRNREDRYLRISADPAGNFEMTGIPPGRYILFAFEDIEPGAYYAFNYSPGLLDRYIARGQRVEFTEGSRLSTLKAIAIPASETRGGLR
jgi:hypothetical protein